LNLDCVDFLALPLQVASGGDPDGTLDFYAVHGYALWIDDKRDYMLNMFRHPKDHWQVDKPILVGEHWDQVRREGLRGLGLLLSQ
jgi:hypothetical protein